MMNARLTDITDITVKCWHFTVYMTNVPPCQTADSFCIFLPKLVNLRRFILYCTPKTTIHLHSVDSSHKTRGINKKEGSSHLLSVIVAGTTSSTASLHVIDTNSLNIP